MWKISVWGGRIYLGKFWQIIYRDSPSPSSSLTIRRTFIFRNQSITGLLWNIIKVPQLENQKTKPLTVIPYTKGFTSLISCCPPKNPVKLAHKETVAYNSHIHSKTELGFQQMNVYPPGSHCCAAPCCLLPPSSSYHCESVHISSHWFQILSPPSFYK